MSERQYGKYLTDYRGDHIGRYEYAAKIVKGSVFDAACGSGYGSYVMCYKNNDCEVLGVDCSKEAIDFANKTWKHERNKFECWDLTEIFPMKSFDWFISFETIEHLEDPAAFLKHAAKISKNFICSVPNENNIPFTKSRFPYHYRHYTPEEIIALFNKCGFTVTSLQYQRDAWARTFNPKGGRSIVIQGITNL